MKRRNILAASIACSALPLAGCSLFRRKPLTQELFADKQYQEEVSSFMMTADRRKLIVLGKQHHYVLDMPRQLETVLTSSFRPKVEASFSNFKATGDEISGSYSLRLPNPVAVEDERAAAAAGFERTRDGAMLLEGGLSGCRYDAREFSASAQSQQFNKAYSISITEQLTAGETVARLPLTPLTAAVDGTMFLASVPLVIIGIPIVLIVFRNGFRL
ncbi:hypothetical protein [Cupriavidus pauculus]|uniref:hypothetical protein n=2 Tax=Cupriavidus pauculus TaxID=82633 RepID=UPI00203C0A46|nr:hypothetical protein [Cupriavidus pauculus]MCM3604806.1 hypothetical protein [Cupriavidus pauculus]